MTYLIKKPLSSFSAVELAALINSIAEELEAPEFAYAPVTKSIKKLLKHLDTLCKDYELEVVYCNDTH